MSSSHELFREIGRRILQWWYENKRDYPWRHERDPYRILIAEIMLQRTKAEQVVPVYVEFISRYPTVQDLAKKKVKKVLGLGAQGLRLRPPSTPRSLEDRYYDAHDYHDDYNDVP